MKKKELENRLKALSDSLVPNSYDMLSKKELSPEYNFLKGKVREKSKVFKGLKLRLAASMLSLFLIAVSLFGLGIYAGQDSYTVYLDVNPSLALVISNSGKVNSLQAFNEETISLIDGQTFKGLKEEQALERFLNLCIESGYLSSESEDNELLISVESKKDSISEAKLLKLLGRANSYLHGKNIECNVDTKTVKEEEREQAEELEITPGKMKIINEIIALDSIYTAESLKDLSMKELQNILKDLKKNPTDDGSSGNENTDNGNSDKGNSDSGNSDNSNDNSNKRLF